MANEIALKNAARILSCEGAFLPGDGIMGCDGMAGRDGVAGCDGVVGCDGVAGLDTGPGGGIADLVRGQFHTSADVS